MLNVQLLSNTIFRRNIYILKRRLMQLFFAPRFNKLWKWILYRAYVRPLARRHLVNGTEVGDTCCWLGFFLVLEVHNKFSWHVHKSVTFEGCVKPHAEHVNGGYFFMIASSQCSDFFLSLLVPIFWSILSWLGGHEWNGCRQSLLMRVVNSAAILNADPCSAAWRDTGHSR